MGINVKQYEGHEVYPRDDAVLYDSIINQSGIIKGCEVTHLGANLLSVASGYGVIKGRLFEITEQTIYARLSENGTIQGRIKIRMELSNADLPIQIITEFADKLPDLEQDEECNYNGGNYEIELAQYSINEIALSGLEATAPQVDVLRGLKDLTSAFNSHAHDDRYFTEAEVTNLLKSKQDAATAINTSNIGQQSVKYASSAGGVTWGDVTGKPSAFPPANTGDYYAKSQNVSVATATWYTSANVTVPPGIYIVWVSAYAVGGSVRVGISGASGQWSQSSGGHELTQFMYYTKVESNTNLVSVVYPNYVMSDTIYSRIEALRIA
ncbi:MAG: hypothetical protein K2N01_13380 [Lachnospiraceae bacterium]|nr:hypothetical protein [Lachnospiraceae bacterium]